MIRESIFPRGVKLHHKETPLVVNVYRSKRTRHGIHYGYARHTPHPSKTALYRIRITWK